MFASRRGRNAYHESRCAAFPRSQPNRWSTPQAPSSIQFLARGVQAAPLGGVTAVEVVFPSA
jgi:hypothetical protein